MDEMPKTHTERSEITRCIKNSKQIDIRNTTIIRVEKGYLRILRNKNSSETEEAGYEGSTQ